MFELTIFGSTTVFGPVAILFTGIVILCLVLMFISDLKVKSFTDYLLEGGVSIWKRWYKHTDWMTGERDKFIAEYHRRMSE